MAPIHRDDDVGISLCCQLEKSGCPDEVLDFIYAHYGLYFETRSNMAWYGSVILSRILSHLLWYRAFNSDMSHGSMMPSLSQMAANLLDLSRRRKAIRKRAASAIESQAKRSHRGYDVARDLPLPLPHQLQRAQPNFPFQTQDGPGEADEQPGDNFQQAQPAPNLAQGPHIPRIVCNGGHATRRTADHQARQQNERTREALPAAQVYWEGERDVVP